MNTRTAYYHALPYRKESLFLSHHDNKMALKDDIVTKMIASLNSNYTYEYQCYTVCKYSRLHIRNGSGSHVMCTDGIPFLAFSSVSMIRCFHRFREVSFVISQIHVPLTDTRNWSRQITLIDPNESLIILFQALPTSNVRIIVRPRIFQVCIFLSNNKL